MAFSWHLNSLIDMYNQNSIVLFHYRNAIIMINAVMLDGALSCCSDTHFLCFESMSQVLFMSQVATVMGAYINAALTPDWAGCNLWPIAHRLRLHL